MNFFDCWWTLIGNRAAENNNEGHSVYSTLTNTTKTRGDRRSEIEINPKRRGLRHDELDFMNFFD